MHRPRFRYIVYSTIDEGCSNFVSPVQDGITLHMEMAGWSRLGQGTQNCCTPIDGRISGGSKFNVMHSCQHKSLQPHLQHQIDEPRRGFVEYGKSSLESANSSISPSHHLNIIDAIFVDNPNADLLSPMQHLSKILC
jgi:hypothetical protein